MGRLLFKGDMHQHAVDNFSRELKTRNNISGSTLPVRSPDLNITENVFIAITLELRVETDEIKNASGVGQCSLRIWRPLFIKYILNLHASIPHKLHSLIAGKYFFLQSTKHLEKVCFCC